MSDALPYELEVLRQRVVELERQLAAKDVEIEGWKRAGAIAAIPLESMNWAGTTAMHGPAMEQCIADSLLIFRRALMTGELPDVGTLDRLHAARPAVNDEENETKAEHEREFARPRFGLRHLAYGFASIGEGMASMFRSLRF